MGIAIDLGLVLQGTPHSTFTFDGSACDPSGVFCTAIAGDPSAQTQALSETRSMSKELFFLKYYPFVSLELGYRFQSRDLTSAGVDDSRGPRIPSGYCSSRPAFIA